MGEIRHNITFDSPRVLEYLGAMPGSVSRQLHTSNTLLHLLYHSLLQILNMVGGVISDYRLQPGGIYMYNNYHIF